MGYWLAKAVYEDGSELEKDFPNVSWTVGISNDKEKERITEFMKNLKKEDDINCTTCAVNYIDD